MRYKITINNNDNKNKKPLFLRKPQVNFNVKIKINKNYTWILRYIYMNRQGQKTSQDVAELYNLDNSHDFSERC